LANVWVLHPKGHDEWEEERRPEKMMDALTKRARRATWAHVVVGGALCSWPITSAETPHPLPPGCALAAPGRGRGGA